MFELEIASLQDINQSQKIELNQILNQDTDQKLKIKQIQIYHQSVEIAKLKMRIKELQSSTDPKTSRLIKNVQQIQQLREELTLNKVENQQLNESN